MINVDSITIEQFKRAIAIKEQIAKLKGELTVLLATPAPVEPETAAVEPAEPVTAPPESKLAVIAEASATAPAKPGMSAEGRARIAAAAKARWAKVKAAEAESVAASTAIKSAPAKTITTPAKIKGSVSEEDLAKVTLAKQPYPTLVEPWANSLGMKFVPVSGTKVLFGVWDARVADYRAYASAVGEVDDSWEKPGFPQGENHPVVNVSWNDAQAFCRWLTENERGEGQISDDQSYRLPTDWEWSVAVGLNEVRGGTPQDKDSKIKGVYPWGEQWPPPSGAGNYAGNRKVDNYEYTSPVGNFTANRHGLYDMGGNVWQWCEDEYSKGLGTRVLRGASWYDETPGYLLSSYRFNCTPDNRILYLGFRCVLASGASRSAGQP